MTVKAEKINKEEKSSQDSMWKEIIERYFSQFLEFFFPEIHKDINFKRKPRFLDKEFEKIVKDSKVGKRIADRLVRVFLKDGNEKWLLLHIEVQGKKEKKFSERVYIYNYRIFDKHYKEVISLAILTDKNKSFRPGKYEIKRWGFKHTFIFPVIKIMDYEGKEEELEKSNNIFALIVSIYLKLFSIKKYKKKLFSLKLSVAKGLYKTGKFERKEVIELLRFIDWLIILPKDLGKKFDSEILKLEEERSVAYVTSFERHGYERGIEKGIEKGMEIGKLEIAKNLIERNTPIEDIAEITRLGIDVLKKYFNKEIE